MFVFLKSVFSYTINFAVNPEKTMIALLTAWFVAVCYGMDEITSKEKGNRTIYLKMRKRV